MLFSSLVFLWFFLPVTVLGSLFIRNIRLKNLWLLFASLFFYGWGEPRLVLLMVVSITSNFCFGLLVEHGKSQAEKRLFLSLAVLVNLGLLGYFKYYDFFCGLLNDAAGRTVLVPKNIALPIGISFYTFQALSYVIDVYRGVTRAQKSPEKLALYVSFFPQLIAGPIVKYRDIAAQIEERFTDWQSFAYGIRRFTLGLAKKVILANAYAAVVDRALSDAFFLSRGTVLFAVLLYTLQIYYDFSGYSDMAIGLGKMFGFTFLENFNYPYLSSSVQEFWRRWHISLSTWFKEYLYIPLGGNRKGKGRTYFNLLVVFFATGLWHGAGVTFILWGLWHGLFLVLERLGLGSILEALRKRKLGIFCHLYTMAVVIFGWMLFRAEDMGQFSLLLGKLLTGANGAYTLGMYMDRRMYFWLFFGILFCGPVQTLIRPLGRWLSDDGRTSRLEPLFLGVVFLYCIMLLVNNTYNPFIYFRF